MNSEFRKPTWLGSGQIPFLCCRLSSSLCILIWWKEGQTGLWRHFQKGFTLIPNYFSKAPPPSPSHWNQDFNSEIWGAHKHLVYCTKKEDVISWQCSLSSLTIHWKCRSICKSGEAKLGLNPQLTIPGFTPFKIKC